MTIFTKRVDMFGHDYIYQFFFNVNAEFSAANIPVKRFLLSMLKIVALINFFVVIFLCFSALIDK